MHEPRSRAGSLQRARWWQLLCKTRCAWSAVARVRYTQDETHPAAEVIDPITPVAPETTEEAPARTDEAAPEALEEAPDAAEVAEAPAPEPEADEAESGGQRSVMEGFGDEADYLPALATELAAELAAAEAELARVVDPAPEAVDPPMTEKKVSRQVRVSVPVDAYRPARRRRQWLRCRWRHQQSGKPGWLQLRPQ